MRRAAFPLETFALPSLRLRARTWVLYALVLAGLLVPRLPALDRFVTVDEATWVMRAGNFYYALAQREFENTFTAYHPAVTTMWAGALATWIEFPEYRGQGQGYFIKEWKFADFLAEYGHHPLEILETARLIIVIANSLLGLAVFHLARRLFGGWAALVLLALLAFDPLLLGHSRILAHEGMMSLLLVVSIFALLVVLEKKGGRFWLPVSAVAAALAVLTKSSATIVLAFAAVVLFWGAFFREADGLRSLRCAERWRRWAGDYLLWLAVFSLTFVVVWPGMWVAPGKMLSQVYGNALSYAVTGNNLKALQVTTGPAITPSSNGIRTYLLSFLWRSTPAVWAGLVLVPAALFSRAAREQAALKRTLAVFFAFGAVFLLVMGLAGGRKSAHYIAFTYASVDVAVGAAALLVFHRLQARGRRSALVLYSLVTLGLLGVHILSAARFYPYYFNYQNPIMARMNWAPEFQPRGYGEVIEQAAQYLSEKPEAQKLKVLSWYGIGPFSYFFPGQTMLIPPTETWSPSLVSRLQRADYLVLYYAHQQRRNMPAKLLRDIQQAIPEKTIWLNGIEYIRIYRVQDLPAEVFVPEGAGE